MLLKARYQEKMRANQNLSLASHALPTPYFERVVWHSEDTRVSREITQATQGRRMKGSDLFQLLDDTNPIFFKLKNKY